ncbi:hypothetical protein ZIOFF_013926 [Zingiber officinale]|uniref:Uncharacterized protein n=1 Tax=Zingiber officinale TaxID=94328 RepID=A0A8J5HGK5_ZINOF|nr:hypothetical protein ZIOFF_013926 [Zingiber officinale]
MVAGGGDDVLVMNESDDGGDGTEGRGATTSQEAQQASRQEHQGIKSKFITDSFTISPNLTASPFPAQSRRSRWNCSLNPKLRFDSFPQVGEWWRVQRPDAEVSKHISTGATSLSEGFYGDTRKRKARKASVSTCDSLRSVSCCRLSPPMYALLVEVFDFGFSWWLLDCDRIWDVDSLHVVDVAHDDYITGEDVSLDTTEGLWME